MSWSLPWRAFARGVVAAIVLVAALAMSQPAFAQAAAGDPDPAPQEVVCKHPRGVASVFRPLSEVGCIISKLRAPKPVPTVAAAQAEAGVASPEAQAAAAGTEVPACVPENAGALDVPRLVVAIFGCRLDEAGWSEDGVRYSTAEALVVAECESHFDTNAVVFGGRYRDTPHPNGNRYSAAGVFQFIRSTGDRWIEGGYANVHDPVANIDAAARLYVSNIQSGVPGWSDWACAAVSDGFAKQSVLPGWPGGPAELPSWAFDLQQ